MKEEIKEMARNHLRDIKRALISTNKEENLEFKGGKRFLIATVWLDDKTYLVLKYTKCKQYFTLHERDWGPIIEEVPINKDTLSKTIKRIMFEFKLNRRLRDTEDEEIAFRNPAVNATWGNHPVQISFGHGGK
jgi:hypothetical protein